MISEQELEALSFPGAPKIVSGVLPGPTSAALLEEVPNYESMTRGGGRFPLIFDTGKGVTVLDPDGNLYIDLTAGVAVNSVGRVHPEVIAAIERQAAQMRQRIRERHNRFGRQRDTLHEFCEQMQKNAAGAAHTHLRQIENAQRLRRSAHKQLQRVIVHLKAAA